MTLPEGRMRLQLERTEIWALHLALSVSLSDYPYPGESLSARLRPILGKLTTYLEATDGAPPTSVQPDPAPEARLG